MKKIVSLILMLSALGGAQSAFADQFTYPVLNDYQVEAEKLIAQTQAVQTPAELAQVASDTENLVQLGVEVMKLYQTKNPNCTQQFTAFLQDLPQMESLTVDQVHQKYHDGVGLPSAPKHCYFGRSQIVHPVMNIIRMKGTWNDDAKDEVIDDFQEVIEHLAKIQKNLDNPPN